MITTYLIGLILFSAIKIGAVIITKYRKKSAYKIQPLVIIFDCIFWPICCIYLICLSIKVTNQQRFIKKIRVSKGNTK